MGQIFAGEPMLLAIHAAAKADVESINLGASREAGSKLTDPIRQADAARDEAFTSLRDFAGLWATSPVATPEQKAAGHRVRGVFTRHGNSLHRMGYTAQTGALQKLFTELSSEGSKADLALLGLVPLHEKLVKAQKEFERIWGQRSEEATEKDLPLISKHLPALRRRVSVLLSVIDEVDKLGPSPEVAALIAKLDAITTEVMTPVQARQTREKKKATKPAKTAKTTGADGANKV
jgi:hypothetical protein